jgi:putative nucleotidyltransferase with HDIG domain
MIPLTNQYETQPTIIRSKVDIETLLITKLPPSPGTMMRITTLLRDYNASTREVTQAISYEPVLVVRILRLANSPVYALERNVTSIQAAMAAVGTKAIHDIVMIGLASTTFSKEIKNSPIAKKIWEHSLAVAMTARELSKVLGMRGTEEAFTCGLLHDIGKLILLSNDVEGYPRILEYTGENDMLWGEDELYGYNHAEVGSLIARRWNLPEEVYYSILHHHNPSQSEQGNIVTHLVDIADTMANIKGFGLRTEEESKLEHSESVMKLGFTPAHLENAWKNAESNINEVIKTFA